VQLPQERKKEQVMGQQQEHLLKDSELEGKKLCLVKVAEQQQGQQEGCMLVMKVPLQNLPTNQQAELKGVSNNHQHLLLLLLLALVAGYSHQQKVCLTLCQRSPV
jgi:hypothetical protein